jgi:hypothetical protein
MTINLYREDGYSLWVLLNRFPQLLSALEDDTPPDDPRIVVFYRPSFGRQSDSPTGFSKQFGEFDLLIGTPKGVYPIESKPANCGELDRRTKVLTLREEQIRRHRIFRTYRTLWQTHRPSSWNDFRSAAMNEFLAAHPGWTMAERKNLLAKNLNFVLKSLEGCGELIQDTILLFHTERQCSAFTNDHRFKCVAMPLDLIPGSDFISIESTLNRESDGAIRVPHNPQ